jgi:hypothetical protein
VTLPEANFRSSGYYIAETRTRCAHCGQETRVLALALPPNHEMLVEDEWQFVDAAAFVFHVTALPESVQRELNQLSNAFRPASGADAPKPLWANHCEHCGALVSDDELHCEPGGFMPSDSGQAPAIVLLAVPQLFSAVAAGYASDPEFFVFMRKR